MDEDWETNSVEEVPVKANSKVAPKKKWEGEDEEEDSAPDDWEASSSEEEAKPAPVPVAAPRKKGTLKAKLAEKEATKVSQKDTHNDLEDVTPLDPAEKKRLDRERELNADLSNAADLFGTTSLATASTVKDLEALLAFNPRTKEDFHQLSARIIEIVIHQHQSKPLYSSFVEHHVRELCQPLRDVEVRKAASVLTTLANEKQKEQRDKVGGKKKSKAAAKPILGAAKSSNKFDTNIYEDSLDDFGANDDDFM